MNAMLNLSTLPPAVVVAVVVIWLVCSVMPDRIRLAPRQKPAGHHVGQVR